MKILILVLSYTQEPYLSLMRAQQETWDSKDVEDVKTIYYHGGEPGTWIKCRKSDGYVENSWGYTEIGFNTTDEYYFMAAKFKKCLEYVRELEYDIIFRTNSSSYVNKERLLDFAKNLPTKKLYAGWTMVDSEDHGGLVVSGAGIFLSRDTTGILRENIDPNFEQEEDIYCGRILRKHGIVAVDDKSRYDIPSQFSEIPLDRYHYRFKTGDRVHDAANMKLVHQKII